MHESTFEYLAPTEEQKDRMSRVRAAAADARAVACGAAGEQPAQHARHRLHQRRSRGACARQRRREHRERIRSARYCACQQRRQGGQRRQQRQHKRQEARLKLRLRSDASTGVAPVRLMSFPASLLAEQRGDGRTAVAFSSDTSCTTAMTSCGLSCVNSACAEGWRHVRAGCDRCNHVNE